MCVEWQCHSVALRVRSRHPQRACFHSLVPAPTFRSLAHAGLSCARHVQPSTAQSQPIVARVRVPGTRAVAGNMSISGHATLSITHEATWQAMSQRDRRCSLQRFPPFPRATISSFFFPHPPSPFLRNLTGQVHQGQEPYLKPFHHNSHFPLLCPLALSAPDREKAGSKLGCWGTHNGQWY